MSISYIKSNWIQPLRENWSYFASRLNRDFHWMVSYAKRRKLKESKVYENVCIVCKYAKAHTLLVVLGAFVLSKDEFETHTHTHSRKKRMWHWWACEHMLLCLTLSDNRLSFAWCHQIKLTITASTIAIVHGIVRSWILIPFKL